MGKIITFLSCNNAGATTSALLFSKTLAEIINKNVLLVDLNYKNPKIHKILSGEYDEEPRFNIDIVMNYAISEKELKAVIETNSEKMINSKLKILMGSNAKAGFESEQYINFFNQVEKMYDFTVIDTFIDKVPKEIIDYSNKIYFVVDQNKNSIVDASKKYWKVLQENNVEILLNKYEDGVLEQDKIEKILNKKVNYKLSYEKRIIKHINDGNLNLDECNYSNQMDKVCKEMLKQYSYQYKSKRTLKEILQGVINKK